MAKPEFRERMRKATGRTLLAPTLAERLAGHGGSIVMSNVSAGAGRRASARCAMSLRSALARS